MRPTAPVPRWGVIMRRAAAPLRGRYGSGGFPLRRTGSAVCRPCRARRRRCWAAVCPPGVAAAPANAGTATLGGLTVTSRDAGLWSSTAIDVTTRDGCWMRARTTPEVPVDGDRRVGVRSTTIDTHEPSGPFNTGRPILRPRPDRAPAAVAAGRPQTTVQAGDSGGGGRPHRVVRALKEVYTVDPRTRANRSLLPSGSAGARSTG